MPGSPVEPSGDLLVAESPLEITLASPAGDWPRLSPASSVLAVVPHFRCEAWLPDCIESLLAQTRRPEGVVVVDDASGEPPVEIVQRYPDVILLAAAENVGPYCLMQSVVANTAYDAYMFQDADDWSLP